MKTGIKWLILSISVLFLSYSITSFITAEIDISLWTEDQRIGTIAFFLMFMFIAFIINYHISER